MATHELLTLSGCAPTPLASYLKALGVLRLISTDANHVSGQAADPKARGWWEGERFHLATRLDRDALCRFFLEEYAPSPIIAPWNGGSGFYPNDNKDGFGPLTSNVAKRFMPMSKALVAASDVVARWQLIQSPKDNAKEDFVAALRAELPDEALAWLDASLALSGDGLAYPQLLGTGGNDGRLDFTNNFMRRLVSQKQPLGLFDAVSGGSSEIARSLLASVLFDTNAKGLSSAAVGQFSPGAAGGPNATAGYEGGANVNPWEFVLMLEGAIAFASAATRRHQGGESSASFPFTVRPIGAGFGGVDIADENDARAEFWAPLWRRPARFREIAALFVEGRAVLNQRTARNGLDFARAVTNLGVSRGFSEFVRFGFLMRSGKAFLATPVGRHSTAASPATRLLANLDIGGWLESVRRVSRRDTEPAAAREAIKGLESALFEMADASSSLAGAIQRALGALGEVCEWLAVSRKGRDEVAPPPSLSPEWIRQGDDRTPEFRIASALAGVGLRSMVHMDAAINADGQVQGSSRSSTLRSSLPMAAHFVPVDEGRHAWSGDEAPPAVVWGTGGLVSNMVATLERRLVEGAIRGLDDKLLAGAVAASLADVVAFLSSDFDDARCAALLAGMIWVQPAWLPPSWSMDVNMPHPAIPFAYAALKPIFTPDRTLRDMKMIAETARLPVPPGLLARLRGGGANVDGRATDTAVRTALGRVGASALSSPFEAHRAGGLLPGAEASRFGVGIRADRLAASLLIPVDDYAMKRVIERAYPGALTEETTETTEDTNDAA